MHHRDACALGIRGSAQALHLTTYAHVAAVRTSGIHAGEDLQDGGFAGAIFAAQAEDFAFIRGERGAIECVHAAETLVDVDHLEHGRT